MDDILWGPDHPKYFDTAEEFFGTDPLSDSDKWSRVQYWTLEEGIALSFGFDPRVVNWRVLRDYPEHPQAVEYDRRRDLAERATVTDQLSALSSPRQFIKWAKSVKIVFPDELVNAVRSATAVKSADDATSSRSGLTKMIKTDSKIVLAMVRYTYGFDPSQPLATTIEEIVVELQCVGVSVDVQALRQILRETADLVLDKIEASTHEIFCKVIYGLAVKYHKYDATARRSDTPKEIFKLLQTTGTPVDCDSVRSRLQDGHNLVEVSNS
jgi:hypothetical protein